jgi:FKBP-type peptidyl-prolyl cis-trans isomerase FkpA
MLVRFGLQQVIKDGLKEFPFFFKRGGSGMLVPSHLGYGSNGRGIPGGSVLILRLN